MCSVPPIAQSPHGRRPFPSQVLGTGGTQANLRPCRRPILPASRVNLAATHLRSIESLNIIGRFAGARAAIALPCFELETVVQQVVSDEEVVWS